MALMNCPECGRPISNTTEKCIYCGFPLIQSKPSNDQSINSGVIKHPKKKSDRYIRAVKIIALLCSILFCAIWFIDNVFIKEKYFYDEGVRAGSIVRISKKGVIFKTYEGQLNLQSFGALKGTSPFSETFDFSVRRSRPEIVKELEAVALSGERVNLHYIKRYIRFPWRGDTKYFITEVEREGESQVKKPESEVKKVSSQVYETYSNVQEEQPKVVDQTALKIVSNIYSWSEDDNYASLSFQYEDDPRFGTMTLSGSIFTLELIFEGDRSAIDVAVNPNGNCTFYYKYEIRGTYIHLTFNKSTCGYEAMNRMLPYYESRNCITASTGQGEMNFKP